MHSRSTRSDGEIRSRAVITGDISGRAEVALGRQSESQGQVSVPILPDEQIRLSLGATVKTWLRFRTHGEFRGNQDSGRIRLCRPRSPCEILGGGAPLSTTRSARGLRVLGRALESHGSARSRLEQRERDRRSGKTRTPDLLPADGHAKTEEEPGPSGPEYLRRKQNPKWRIG